MARFTGRPRGGQQLLASSARQRISMSLRDRLVIDAVMDNTQQSARDDYDHHLAVRAGAIRQHGWDETGHITRPISEQAGTAADDELARLVVGRSARGRGYSGCRRGGLAPVAPGTG